MSIRKSLLLGAAISAMTHRMLAEQKAKELTNPSKDIAQTNWQVDVGKKNTETKACGKCRLPFFGLRKRKFCVHCEPIVTKARETLHNTTVDTSPYSSGKRRRR